MHDSMHSNMPDMLQEQITALLYTKDESITLRFAKVSMQTNGSDCGAYAIAYATALCLRISPESSFMTARCALISLNIWKMVASQCSQCGKLAEMLQSRAVLCIPMYMLHLLHAKCGWQQHD